MHSVAYNCPVVNLHMIGGIDCDEPTLEAMCSAPVSIECPLCGTIHPIRLRRRRRGDDFARSHHAVGAANVPTSL